MKDFVRIQSEIDIQVTAGLQALNATNYKSSQADRLNVKPVWNEFCIMIHKGLGFYPSEIKTWNTVKSLEKKGLLTVGAEVDEYPDDPAGVYAPMAVMLKEKEKLLIAANKYESRKKQLAEDKKLILESQKDLSEAE